MLKRFPLFLFPLTVFLNINPTTANSNEDNWYNFGFSVGTFTQTCLLAVDKIISTKDARYEMEIIFDDAQETLARDFYESFTGFAYDEEDCIKYLP